MDDDLAIRRLVAEFHATGSVGALDELQRVGARDALRAAVIDAPDSVRKEEAAGALAELRDPRDLSFLLDLLRDNDVQDSVQAYIEQQWGSEATRALAARLPSCTDDCLCLIEALKHIGDADALAPLGDALLVPDEIEAEWAAQALAAVATRCDQRPAAIAHLRRARRQVTNPYVLEEINAALRELGDPAVDNDGS